jgi:hypothetical protein
MDLQSASTAAASTGPHAATAASSKDSQRRRPRPTSSAPQLDIQVRIPPDSDLRRKEQRKKWNQHEDKFKRVAAHTQTEHATEHGQTELITNHPRSFPTNPTNAWEMARKFEQAGDGKIASPLLVYEKCASKRKFSAYEKYGRTHTKRFSTNQKVLWAKNQMF